SDENGQNEEPPVQSLSLIYNNNSAAEEEDAVEAASERISLAIEREDMDEELMGQDIREHGEGGAVSANGAWEEQELERESEEEPQRTALIKPPQANMYVNVMSPFGRTHNYAHAAHHIA
ncbi:MAG: hypothetical protein L6R40_008394, partial [Gallowayella cf. fulva]